MIQPYYSDASVTLYHGDALEVLRTMPDHSVDAVVTDPPYELGFMGRAWDASGIAYSVGLWREVFRVLKPGGHLLAFGGTRTVHRLTCAIEDAGFEIRDGIDWVYGSGFPKSLDVSKAIDKAAGAEREVVGVSPFAARKPNGSAGVTSAGYEGCASPGHDLTAPATDGARQWEGWGTALKPAREPIVMARKPLTGTVAGNVLAYGTGALNIDATRVPTDEDRGRPPRTPNMIYGGGNGTSLGASESNSAGRWPTNVVLSHAPLLDQAGEIIGDACADGCVPGCPVLELDAQSGTLTSGRLEPNHTDSGKSAGTYGAMSGRSISQRFGGDSGGASRFFPVFRYEPKAPTAERPRADGTAHPTVKPLALMRWLIRLVTPPGGKVLDLFAGSGTTGEACVIEGFRCILIEQHEPYLPLIVGRLSKPLQPALDIFGGAA